MSRLQSLCEQLQLTHKSGGDAAAVSLELLHALEHVVRTASEVDLKGGQAKLEEVLTGALLLGPAAPCRRLIASTFCLLYARGTRTTLYTTMGLLLSLMGNKAMPNSSTAILDRAAVLQVLGALCAAHGLAMVSLCADAFTLLIKTARAPEQQLRVHALEAAAVAVSGSGGVSAILQAEALKGLKANHSQRGAAPELRIACLRFMAPLCLHADGLWTVGAELLEGCLSLATKSLDDGSPSVRAAAGSELGEVLAVMLARGKEWGSANGDKGKGGGKTFGKKLHLVVDGKKQEAGSAVEAALASIAMPFVRSGASRVMRAGLARALVRLFGAMKRYVIERHAKFLLQQVSLTSLTSIFPHMPHPIFPTRHAHPPPHFYQRVLFQVLSMLSLPSEGVLQHPCDCVSHMLRAGLSERLSERGQCAVAGTLATSATARNATEPAVLVSLRELSQLLPQLCEVSLPACETLIHGERPLLVLTSHPSPELRLAALSTLHALALAAPLEMPSLLNVSINRLRTEHAKLLQSAATAAAAARGGRDKGGSATVAEAAREALLSPALAVATLIATMARAPLGAPSGLATDTLASAADLAAAEATHEPAGEAAWLLLRSMLLLDAEWLCAKPRLSKILGMLQGALGSRYEGTFGRDGRELLETALRTRGRALGALAALLRALPELATAPLVKSLASAVLPANSALLADCAARAAALMGTASFRGAFMRFRARIYELLAALPSSTLSAKVLNVVMPMVVADIVDPASAHCGGGPRSALAAMLNATDDHLGDGTSEVAGGESLSGSSRIADEEPLCGGRLVEATAACEWLRELEVDVATDVCGGAAHRECCAADKPAIEAAVGLFGAVFRLQTSDVRAQLLGHLETAAAKAAAGRVKAEGPLFALSGAKRVQGSPLANMCAALLGSLQRLTNKPSKSVLTIELAKPLTHLIDLCLAESDAAVRRGAAQCVGALGALLGARFVESFCAIAQQRICGGGNGTSGGSGPSGPSGGGGGGGGGVVAPAECRAGYALALAHLSRQPAVSVGSSLLVRAIEWLGALSGGPSVHATEWALHSLWTLVAHAVPGQLTAADACGCMSAASSVLLSEPPPSAHAALAIVRLSTALAKALCECAERSCADKDARPSPALVELAATLARCRVLSSAACGMVVGGAGEKLPSLRSEELYFEAQMLRLPPPLGGIMIGGAPAVVQTPLEALQLATLSGLGHAYAPLRRAALVCQRNLGTKGAIATGRTSRRGASLSKILTALFALLDRDPELETRELAQLVLVELLQASCVSAPAFWLRALTAIATESKAKGGAQGGERGAERAERADDNDDDDDEAGGGWDQNASGLPSGDMDENEEEMRKRQKEAQVEAEEQAKWAQVRERLVVCTRFVETCAHIHIICVLLCACVCARLTLHADSVR